MNKHLKALRATGQSLWLDNITRTLLDDGTLERYIAEYDLTGLTSNPSIFDKAFAEGDAYDAAIAEKHAKGLDTEALFVELALEDLRRAAKLFEPAFEASDGKDGWVSMELSPLLAADTQGSIAAATQIHEQAACKNLYIKIPGTPEGLAAIEESIYNGVPVNVTLLFSAAQYVAAAEAYLRGIERRVQEGKDPVVSSVASLFVSRWDKAVADKVPQELKNTLGIAVGKQAYRAYRDLLASDRWKTLSDAGAQPQRLLWASTSAKDPDAPDDLYVSALAAPETVDTVPEDTLNAFAENGTVDSQLKPGADVGDVLAPFAKAGIDTDAVADKLQVDGAQSFVDSWHQLMQRIRDKVKALA